MSERLTMYNLALLYCGERALSSLTEDREPRRLLDQVWNTQGVRKCLEEGQWRFATRAIQIDYDPSIDPGFGYTRAFPQPSDYVLTCAVSLDEYFREPFLDYAVEAGHWYAEHDTMYVRYVSDDENYGLNINDWPGYFEDFVAADFASKVIWKLSASEHKLKAILGLREKAKDKALNKDKMGEPTKFPPTGSWVRSRSRQGRGPYRSGTTGNLL